MWQISDPPVTVANLGYYIFGYVHDLGQIRGLPISPKWTNLEIFCTKWKLKGGLFYTKKCKLINLGPHNAGRFGQMWVSANQPKLAQFQIFSTLFNTFLYKIQIERGSILWKNLPTCVFWGPRIGLFWTYWGVCRSAHN